MVSMREYDGPEDQLTRSVETSATQSTSADQFVGHKSCQIKLVFRSPDQRTSWKTGCCGGHLARQPEVVFQQVGDPSPSGRVAAPLMATFASSAELNRSRQIETGHPARDGESPHQIEAAFVVMVKVLRWHLPAAAGKIC